MSSATGEWSKTGSWIVVDKPEFVLELDEWRRPTAAACGLAADQMLFVHLWVRQWTKEVLLDLFRTWPIFRQCITAPIYAAGEEDDDKFAHFVRLFGFRPLTDDNECTDGKRRRIFIHLLDHDNVRQPTAEDAGKPSGDVPQ